MSTLVVEHSQLIADFLRCHIKGMTWVARTISEGLALAVERQPAVIVTSALLRGDDRNAVELIPEYRARSPRAQILVMTASFEERDARRALSLGALAYLPKSDLLAICDWAIRARQLVKTYFHPLPSPSLLH